MNSVEFQPDGSPEREGPPTAIHVSNFRPVKRVPWLVEAFLEATAGTDAHLVLVGDGPERDPAETLTRERGATDRVTFLGERDVLPSLLKRADLFLLASTEESFGLSALEAMSCALPVVAPKVGGVPEVVTDGETGWLTAPDDRPAYLAALRDALFNKQERSRRGAAAREDAIERFSIDAVVAHYESIYSRLALKGANE